MGRSSNGNETASTRHAWITTSWNARNASAYDASKTRNAWITTSRNAWSTNATTASTSAIAFPPSSTTTINFVWMGTATPTSSSCSSNGETSNATKASTTSRSAYCINLVKYRNNSISRKKRGVCAPESDTIYKLEGIIFREI